MYRFHIPFVNLTLCFYIKTCSRFIQDKYRSILVQRSCQSKFLRLATCARSCSDQFGITPASISPFCSSAVIFSFMVNANILKSWNTALINFLYSSFGMSHISTPFTVIFPLSVCYYFFLYSYSFSFIRLPFE